MEKPSILFLLSILMFFSVLLRSHPVVAIRTEHWGYTKVRQVTEDQGAHLFWWYYESGIDSSSEWPIIIWLQGGPGSSGALGNFLHIGPMTDKNQERPHTWLWIADLLFVDSPVGTGFSYVDHDSLLVKSDEEAAYDILILLKDLFHRPWSNFKNRPLYIYGEGYGGKIAACLGLLVNHATLTRELEFHPRVGVILADSWISPEDSALALGPLLKDFSRLSSIGLEEATSLTNTLQRELSGGQYLDAKTTWDALRKVIARNSFNVDLHNLFLDDVAPLDGPTTIYGTERIMRKADSRSYSTHVLPNDQTPFDFSDFMNRNIRQKLHPLIIPEKVNWIHWNQKVLDAMSADYMKPKFEVVADLLLRGVSVTIINGQYDVVCSTKGAEAWVEKLTRWGQLTTFLESNSIAYELEYLGDTTTAALIKSHENLAFYSILRSGHYVTLDQPVLLQLVVERIIKSPATVPQTVLTHG